MYLVAIEILRAVGTFLSGKIKITIITENYVHVTNVKINILFLVNLVRLFENMRFG
jgi:hypothetical protein